MDGYERLASAIVAQAEEDYIKNHKKIKEYGKKIERLKANLSSMPRSKNEINTKIKEYELKIKKLNYEVDEIVDFFYSSWFRTLSTKDPDYVLEKLEEVVDDS